jgi:hypothetical protein
VNSLRQQNSSDVSATSAATTTRSVAAVVDEEVCYSDSSESVVVRIQESRFLERRVTSVTRNAARGDGIQVGR